MQPFSTVGWRLRPWIAVVVSYAMLFQAILTGVTTSLAVADNSESFGTYIICSANGDQSATPFDDSERAPVHGRICPLCLMAGSAPAVLPPIIMSSFVGAAEVVRFAAFLRGQVVCELHTPRQSQGPPSAA
jgi:hypothetical protein